MLICSDCLNRVTSCPNCRATVPVLMPEESTTLWDDVPLAISDDISFDVAMSNFITPNKPMIKNLNVVMQLLKHFGFYRVLLVLEDRRCQTRGILDTTSLSRSSGFQITRVDHLMTGKGGEWSKIKAKYDSTEGHPQALLSYGLDTILVGANLNVSDAFVCVGNLNPDLITQAIGRVFRPRVGRNPSKPMKLVRLFTTTSQSNRRRRSLTID